MSSLIPFWYVVIAILWTGFFILEGFDFGVGMLHSLIGRDEAGRRAAINTIGPLWDGNEVWLIVGGAAIFAAFPAWYATWFSAGYLALMLLLVGAAQARVQHPDAEVEALQDEEPGPEQGHEDEPDDGQAHDGPLSRSGQRSCQ